MNLNPRTWFSQKNAAALHNQGGGIAASIRESRALGPYTGVFDQWNTEPRSVSPWLYESLKEAIPMLDGGISRLVTLDGIIEVEGGNDRLVSEITEWMQNIPVNDLETGFQAAYASGGEELYEQGLAVTEFVYDAKGRDVIGLRVADSKGIHYVRDSDRIRVFYRAPSVAGDRRPDGMGNVEQILRGAVRASDRVTALLGHGYVELDPQQLMIAVHRPEADNPYGTSVLRSLPFVSQIILRMQNATGRVWERFGDPSFHVAYSTKNRKIDNAGAQRRAETIASGLATALAGKKAGNSVDLATGVGADDEISINVIGAVSEALQIEMPARHMLEQVVAAFNLPAWMLGITWAQAAGIGEPQSELVLQDAKTRFARRDPGLRRPIEAMLRARGRTWKAGDWTLVQRLPSLHDEVKRAQANFLNQQALMMQRESGGSPTGLDNQMRSGRQGRRKVASEDEGGGEPWAEQDKQLPRIELGTIGTLLARWKGAKREVLSLLGLDAPAGDTFVFDLAQLPALLVEQQMLTRDLAAELLDGSMQAWERGAANAQADIPPALVANGPKSAQRKQVRRLLLRAHAAGRKSDWWDDPLFQAAVERMRQAIRHKLIAEGLDLVSGGVARTYRAQIVSALASGEFDGWNPVNVASALSARFDAGDYNWERLARSEIAAAQSTGKLDLYREQGVTLYDYVTADDERVSAICRTHEANGPYRIDDPAAPLPMHDSHPNCRCTIVANA